MKGINQRVRYTHIYREFIIYGHDIFPVIHIYIYISRRRQCCVVPLSNLSNIFFTITSWHGSAFHTTAPSTHKGSVMQRVADSSAVSLNTLLRKQSSGDLSYHDSDVTSLDWVRSSIWPWEYDNIFYDYRQVSNTRRTLVGNQIVDHSDVVGASPVGAPPTTSSFST